MYSSKLSQENGLLSIKKCRGRASATKTTKNNARRLSHFKGETMAADPQDIQNVIEGTASLLSVLGFLPSAIVIPLVLLGQGIAGLFRKKKNY
jgi:hypothetical protein